MDAKMSLKIHKNVNYSAPPLTLREATDAATESSAGK